MNREIPIVADEYVELGFGTGAVKMTPAHDPNDFEVGLRHNLETIRVLDDNGKVNANGGKYEGMDRYECRQAIVKDLEEQEAIWSRPSRTATMWAPATAVTTTWSPSSPPSGSSR